MTTKDWVPITISIVALLLSSGSAYLTVIRQMEDLRLVVDGALHLSWSYTQVTVERPDLLMTFTNSGSRSIAVRKIILRVVKLPEQDQVRPNKWVLLGERPFDVEPFVVEAGGIEIIKVGFEDTFVANQNLSVLGASGTIAGVAYFDIMSPTLRCEQHEIVGTVAYGNLVTLAIRIVQMPIQTRILHRKWSTIFS